MNIGGRNDRFAPEAAVETASRGRDASDRNGQFPDVSAIELFSAATRTAGWAGFGNSTSPLSPDGRCTNHSEFLDYHSLNVGSAHPPHTHGKVQSAVSFALSGMYRLHTEALIGFMERQTTSNLPSGLSLPIMAGLER
jgi:hypothetical protein